MNALQSVDAGTAAAMVRDGAILVDIRSPDEHRRLRIAGAHSAPLDRLTATLPAANGRKLIFHCRSGMRTTASAERLARDAGADCCILAGGLDAWRKAGLPVEQDRSQPLEIMRQVQIVAGTLILGGVLLGCFATPLFYAVPGLVGLGLLAAGITGFCGMARLLTWFNGRMAASH